MQPERVGDQHRAQLLHQRVCVAGSVVDVGEHRLALYDEQEVLLAEAGWQERAVFAHEQGLLGRLCDDLLHGSLHGLLHMAQVDGLAQPDEERGTHELENLHRLLGFAGRDEAEGVDVLVVLLGALDVRGDGVGEVVELAEVGRHGDLGALHAIVEAGVGPPGQVGRQAVVVVVIHELAELREHELAYGGHREPHVVHGHPDRRALEVPAVESDAPRSVDDGVVVHGVDLALDDVSRGPDHLNLWAQPLRGSAECVPILLGLFQRIRLVDLRRGFHEVTAVQEPLHHGCGFHLPGVVLQLVRQRVGELRLPLHHLAEQRRQHFRQEHQPVGVEAHGGRQRRAHGRPVHQRQSFLGLQLERLLDARDLQPLERRHLAAIFGLRSGIGSAGEQPRDVRQGHQVARRRDGSPQWQLGRDVRVEQLLHGLENLPADAGVALHERVGAHEHGGAGGLGRQCGPLHDHSCVQEADELALKLHAGLRAAVRGVAEAGGDAVDVPAVHDLGEHPLGGFVHPRLGIGRIQHDLHVGSARDGGDLAHAEVHALDGHFLGIDEGGHHALDLLQMAPLQFAGGLGPVEWVHAGRNTRSIPGGAVEGAGV